MSWTMEINVRQVTPDDIDQLQEIGRQTFYETFAGSNTEDDMQKYLDESFCEHKLTAELTDPNSEFYFAILDKKVIGYLKLNFGQSQTELKDDKALEIERIYVPKEFHGKKSWPNPFRPSNQNCKTKKCGLRLVGRLGRKFKSDKFL